MAHVPFLFWIVAALQPRQVATCGVGAGVAHFAFCQGMDKQNIPGRCRGLGSWVGSSGKSGALEVPKALKEHGEQFYNDVSTLAAVADPYAMLQSLRSHSLDLLLVDLCELGEAEQPSYDEWLERLKPNGVLILHGIEALAGAPSQLSRIDAFLNGRERLEFRSGKGLAVVPLGGAHPPRLQALLKACPSGEVPGEVDLFFRRLGQGLEAVASNAALKPQLSKTRAAVKDAEKKVAAVEAEIKALEEAYEERSRKVAVSQSEAFAYQSQLAELQKAEAEHRLEAEKQANSLKEGLAASKAALEVEQRQRDEKEAELTRQLEAGATELEALKVDLTTAQAREAEAKAALEAETHTRFEETAELTRQLEAARQREAQAETEGEAIQAVRAELEAAQAEVTKLSLAVEAQTRTRFEETAALTRMLEEAQSHKAGLSGLQKQNETQRQHIEELKRELSEAHGVIDGLYQSTSWRVTAPMRRVKTMISKD